MCVSIDWNTNMSAFTITVYYFSKSAWSREMETETMDTLDPGFNTPSHTLQAGVQTSSQTILLVYLGLLLKCKIIIRRRINNKNNSNNNNNVWHCSSESHGKVKELDQVSYSPAAQKDFTHMIISLSMTDDQVMAARNSVIVVSWVSPIIAVLHANYQAIKKMSRNTCCIQTCNMFSKNSGPLIIFIFCAFCFYNCEFVRKLTFSFKKIGFLSFLKACLIRLLLNLSELVKTHIFSIFTSCCNFNVSCRASLWCCG